MKKFVYILCILQGILFFVLGMMGKVEINTGAAAGVYLVIVATAWFVLSSVGESLKASILMVMSQILAFTGALLVNSQYMLYIWLGVTGMISLIVWGMVYFRVFARYVGGRLNISVSLSPPN